MDDDKEKRLRSETNLSWSAFFGAVCFVTVLVFLLLLTAVPLVFGFGALTFSGEKTVHMLKVAGFANTIVFCLSWQGYVIAKWLEERQKKDIPEDKRE